MNTLIIDTGPFVAILDRRDQFHTWAVETSKTVKERFHTCEAVLTETFFRLAQVKTGKQKMLALLSEPNFIVLNWKLNEYRESVHDIMQKYTDTPTSLADACLVSMAEMIKNPVIWTTDAHFKIYRLRNGKKIPLIIPD